MPETRYAIVYVLVPLTAEDDEPEPTEADAALTGELIGVALLLTPFAGSAKVLGTRLTRNPLIAPALSLIEGVG